MIVKAVQILIIKCIFCLIEYIYTCITNFNPWLLNKIILLINSTLNSILLSITVVIFSYYFMAIILFLGEYYHIRYLTICLITISSTTLLYLKLKFVYSILHIFNNFLYYNLITSCVILFTLMGSYLYTGLLFESLNNDIYSSIILNCKIFNKSILYTFHRFDEILFENSKWLVVCTFITAMTESVILNMNYETLFKNNCNILIDNLVFLLEELEKSNKLSIESWIDIILILCIIVYISKYAQDLYKNSLNNNV